MLVLAASMLERGTVGKDDFIGFRDMLSVDEAFWADLGAGRAGWGGCGRRGRVYWRSVSAWVKEMWDEVYVEA